MKYLAPSFYKRKFGQCKLLSLGNKTSPVWQWFQLQLRGPTPSLPTCPREEMTPADLGFIIPIYLKVFLTYHIFDPSKNITFIINNGKKKLRKAAKPKIYIL